MPTRKIADLPKICRHPEHNPPTHMVYEPGIWEHVCPACKTVQTFTVSPPMLAGQLESRPRDPGWLKRRVEEAVFAVSCKPPHHLSEEVNSHLAKLRQGPNVRRN
jgi:hypothetical protein